MNASASRRAQRRRAGRADAGRDAALLRPQREAERADRDHHRVARADLGELLRAGRASASSNAQISSSSASAVRFGPGDELGDRDAARAARRRDLDRRVGGVERRQAVAGGRGGARGCRRPCPRLRICGEPTVRLAIARPGRRSPSSSMSARVRDAGADAHAPVRRAPSSRSSGTRVRSSTARRPRVAEVQRDHQVGAARERHRVGPRRLAARAPRSASPAARMSTVGGSGISRPA